MTMSYLVNGVIVPHSHDFVEVVLIMAGEGLHRSREGEILLQRGDLLVIRPGAWHTYEHCHDLRLYNCCFGYELLGHELAWFGEDTRLNYLFQVGPLSQGRHGILATQVNSAALEVCESHLQLLCDLERQPTLPDKLTTLAYLLLFFGGLARAIVPGNVSTVHIHPAVLEVVRLLEQNTSAAWTMDLLSTQVGLSTAYLSRLFREQMGVPPMSYLQQRRMEQAANLLLHTHWSVAQIGLDVGFNDQNYFARCFKAYYGLSATSYRKRFTEPKQDIHS